MSTMPMLLVLAATAAYAAAGMSTAVRTNAFLSADTTGSIPDVKLGDWVKLKDISYSTSDKTAAATLVVKGEGDTGDSLQVALSGSYASSTLSGTTIKFKGASTSDWDIPGKVDQLNLNSTSIKLTYSKSILGVTSVTGSLKAQVAYKNATFGLITELPPTDGAKGILFAAYIGDDDTLSMASIMGDSYPNVTCLKAGLIFSPEKTTFTFATDSPFSGASYSVVKGLNAVFKVDKTDGDLASLTSIGVDKNFYVEGQIATDGNFSLTGAIDDLTIGDDFDLKDVSFSVSSQSPYLEFSAVLWLHRGVMGSSGSLLSNQIEFELSGSVSASLISLSGSIKSESGAWSITLCPGCSTPQTVTLESAAISWNYTSSSGEVMEGLAVGSSSSSTVAATVSAEAIFGELDVSLTVNYPSTNFYGVAYLADASFGSSAGLENVSMTVTTKDKHTAAQAAATLVVNTSSDGSSPLVVDIAGDYEQDKKKFTLTGTQMGDWAIPGKVDNLTLSNTAASIKYYNDSEQAISGSLTATITYGSASLALAIDMPPPSTSNGVAFAAYGSDSFSLSQLAGVGSNFPEVALAKAAFVFSPYSGSYSFPDPDKAPGDGTADVVPGFNMFLSVDLSASSSLEPVQSSGISGDLTMTGTVSTNNSWTISAAVPALSVGDGNFTLSDATLAFASDTPFVRVAADMTLAAGVMGSSSTTGTQFSMKGEYSSTALSMSGSLSGDWNVTLGTTTSALTGVNLTYARDFSTNVSSASAVAAVEIGTAKFSVAAAYPSVELTATAEALSLEALLAPALGLDPAANLSAPQQLLDEFLQDNLTSSTLVFDPLLGNASFTAKISTYVFGDASLTLTLSYINKSWGYSAVLTPGDGWIFGDSSLVPSSFPHLAIDGCTFVLASQAGTASISRMTNTSTATVTVNIDAGLSFFASLVLNASDSSATLAKWIAGDSAVLDLDGAYSATAWSASVSLAASVPLGSAITLESVGLTIGNASSSYINLNASAHISSSNGTIGVSGSVSSTAVTLKSDYATDLSMEYGTSLTLQAASITVELGYTNSSAPTITSGAATATLLFATAVAEMTLSLDPSSVASFTGSVMNNSILSLQDLSIALVGEATVTTVEDDLPSSVSDTLKSTLFESCTLNLMLSPMSASATGAVALFGQENLAYNFKVSQSSGWQFAFGAALGTGGFNFSTIDSSISSLDSAALANAAISLSSETTTMDFPGSTGTYSVTPGFDFFATLPLTQDPFAVLNKWLGITSLSVGGSVSSNGVVLEADLNGDLALFGKVDVTQAGLKVEALVDGSLSVGVDATLKYNVTGSSTDRLEFKGEIDVSTAGLAFEAEMTTAWSNAFGVPNVTVSETDLSFKISYEMVPLSLGLAGGLHVGEVGGDVAIYVDALTPTKELFHGTLNSISLSTIVDDLCADVNIKTLPKVVDTLTNINLDTLTLNVVDGTESVTFFNHTYSPGIYFEAQNFSLWNTFNGSAIVQVDPTSGVMVEGSLEPVSFLDGAFVLSGAPTATDPLYLQIDLTTNLTVSDQPFKVAGGVSLLGEYLAAAIDVSDSAISVFVNASLLDDRFNFLLNFTGEGTSLSKPTDFTLNTTMTTSVLDWIADTIPGKLNSSQIETDEAYAEAKGNISAQLANLTGLQKAIANLTAIDLEKVGPEEQTLYKAQLALESAKSNVDQLETSIKNKEKQVDGLTWKSLWKEAALEAEIVGLEAAKVVADAALDTAILAVAAAEKLVNSTAVLDPTLIAMQVEYGVLTALYNTEMSLLNATQSMTDVLTVLAEHIAKGSGNLFNLEEFSLLGSYSEIMMGELAILHMKGTFCSHAVDFTVDVNLGTITTWADSVWQAIVDAHFFGNDGQMSALQRMQGSRHGKHKARPQLRLFGH